MITGALRTIKIYVGAPLLNPPRIKPSIRKGHFDYAGVEFSVWVCFTQDHEAVGMTPKEAFDTWIAMVRP